MKEATGEVSGTVVTIVIIALIAGVATAIFGVKDANGKTTAQRWIENMFEKQTGITD